MLYVASIERHDEGTFAYIFNDDDLHNAEQTAHQIALDLEGELVDVVEAEDYFSEHGEILELCAF